MEKLKVDWKPMGYFELSDSNNRVGSLYSIEDIKEILSIKPDKEDVFITLLECYNLLENHRRVLEPELQRSDRWKCIMKACSSKTPKRFQSLSELELIAVIKRTFGEVTFDEQSRKGKRYIDIKASYNGCTKYIEFLGPQHFYADADVDKDIKRKTEIEQLLDQEIVEWPYWIQFCERNVRIAFGEGIEGRGAIWGSEIMWGGVSTKVKDRIIQLTKKFNAVNNDGIGYFYEEWKDNNGNTIKPAHPIVEKIKNGEESIEILLPAKVGIGERKYWLPKELWSLI